MMATVTGPIVKMAKPMCSQSTNRSVKDMFLILGSGRRPSAGPGASPRPARNSLADGPQLPLGLALPLSLGPALPLVSGPGLPLAPALPPPAALALALRPAGLVQAM
jgi:hypothetical protein